jgi:hypothetical protein
MLWGRSAEGTTRHELAAGRQPSPGRGIDDAPFAEFKLTLIPQVGHSGGAKSRKPAEDLLSVAGSILLINAAGVLVMAHDAGLHSRG